MQACKSLEEMALENLMQQKKDELMQNAKDLVGLKHKLQEIREQKFYSKYGRHCRNVRKTYADLVHSCCYQGGKGYRIWNYLTMRNRPHHWVVHPDKYKDCQPTEMDRDAYRIEYKCEMYVPTEMHVEIWGN